MSVTNGQSANQTTFNNAFLSRTTDTSTAGKVDLSNVASESGSAVVNIQRELNSMSSFSGKSINVAKDNKPSWSSNVVGASGDNLFQRADALTVKFSTGDLVTTGTQSFSGAKTWSGAQTWSSTVNGSITTDSSSNGASVTLSTPTTLMLRVTHASLSGIIGLTAPSTPQLLILQNQKASSSITVYAESGSATAANRITTGVGDITLEVGQALWLYYDTTQARWNVVGGSGSGTTLTQLTDMNVYGKEGYGPLEGFDSSGYFKTFTFEKNSRQVLVLAGRVPWSFDNGNQLAVRGHIKSSSGTGNVYVTVTGTLYRGATTETVVFTGTIAATTTLTTFYVNCSTSDGRLNDYFITADDFLVYTFERTSDNGSDTLSADAIIAADSLEVSG